MNAKFVYESLDNVLKPKSEEDIKKGIEDMSLEDYDYSLIEPFSHYNEFNRLLKYPRLRRKARKMMKRGFEEKKDPRILAKEIADKLESML